MGPGHRLRIFTSISSESTRFRPSIGWGDAHAMVSRTGQRALIRYGVMREKGADYSLMRNSEPDVRGHGDQKQ
jgi:hypothetical protein